MKITETHETTSAKTILISALTIIFVYGMPYCSLPVMSVGSAVLFTIVFGLHQDSFRSRSGSLKPALCLATAMWIGATIIAVLSLMGVVR